MPYYPTIPPSSVEDLQRWLSDELNRINSGVIDGQETYGFSIFTSAPPRPIIGLLAFADGVGWDPGAGMGTYEYTDLGWEKLGGGNGGVVPTSHSSLQDLDADDHLQYHTDARGDIRYYTKTIIDDRELNNLANVNTVPTDLQVLTFDAGSNIWVSADPAGGGGQFNIDGGVASSIYNPPANIDGGTA